MKNHIIQEQNVPVVTIDRAIKDAAVDTVRCDSITGAYQLTRHLMDLGHRHIALLNGPKTTSTAIDRATGYQQALAEADLSTQIHYGAFTLPSGYAMGEQAIQALSNFIARRFADSTAHRLPDSHAGASSVVSAATLRALPCLHQGRIMLAVFAVTASPGRGSAMRALALFAAMSRRSAGSFHACSARLKVPQ